MERRCGRSLWSEQACWYPFFNFCRCVYTLCLFGLSASFQVCLCVCRLSGFNALTLAQHASKSHPPPKLCLGAKPGRPTRRFTCAHVKSMSSQSSAFVVGVSQLHALSNAILNRAPWRSVATFCHGVSRSQTTGGMHGGSRTLENSNPNSFP